MVKGAKRKKKRGRKVRRKQRGRKERKTKMNDVVVKWEREKKIGIVQCRPSWGESEIKINKCEWKKMEER
jgi:hypothetical protein